MKKVWQIGYLSASAVDAGHLGFAAFRTTLRELGYEGQYVNLARHVKFLEAQP